MLELTGVKISVDLLPGNDFGQLDLERDVSEPVCLLDRYWLTTLSNALDKTNVSLCTMVVPSVLRQK